MNPWRSRFRLGTTINMVALAVSAFSAGQTAQDWPARWIVKRGVPLDPPGRFGARSA